MLYVIFLIKNNLETSSLCSYFYYEISNKWNSTENQMMAFHLLVTGFNKY